MLEKFRNFMIESANIMFDDTKNDLRSLPKAVRLQILIVLSFVWSTVFSLYVFSMTSFIFLGLIGISNGLANVLGSSTWAEIYGVKHIGSIKALSTALMVFSTAFGTALFGLLIDKGYSIEQIALVSFVYIFISIILLFFVRNRLNPKYI